ncbi:MAG: hypothetical protein ACKOWG_18070, partial [Planctomycetia bacterium]
FDSAAFTAPVWVDLAFLPGDDLLVAFPHRWTSRGLGGQPFLPADDDPRTIWLLDIASGSVQARALPANYRLGSSGGMRPQPPCRPCLSPAPT